MRRSDRNAIRVGLAASALVHGAVLGLVRVRVELPLERPAPAVRPFQGVRLAPAIRIADEVLADVGTPMRPAAAEVPVNTEATVSRMPSAATVVARTSVRFSDTRLWQPAAGPVKGRSDVDRLSDRVAARIAPFNDSIVPPQRAAERAVDWTVGGDTTRWGYRRGSVYISGQRLPFTMELAGHAGSAGRVRDFETARMHLESAHMRGRIEERARALRERSDSLRAAKRRDGGD